MAKTPEEIAAAKKAADKKAADEAARKAALKDQESDEDEDENEDEEEDEETDEDQESEGLEFSAKQKAYIEKLRKENAKARTENKDLKTKFGNLNDRFGKLEGGLKKLFGDGDDDLPPEKKIEKLSQQNEQLALSSALKEAALEHGVGKADYEYFEFLVEKQMSKLKDGEELDAEELEKLAKQAKSKSAPRKTSVDSDGDGDPDPSEDSDEMTLEEFQSLGIVAKSRLYQQDKALYEKLALAEKAAKNKKK